MMPEKKVKFRHPIKPCEKMGLSFFPDAIYDCASLYGKNYKISGEYKLPKDDFLGTPDLSVS